MNLAGKRFGKKLGKPRRAKKDIEVNYYILKMGTVLNTFRIVSKSELGYSKD
jgi:hypothetical protein